LFKEDDEMATVEEVLMRKGPDVIVAGPATTVQQAASLMAQADVGALVIKLDQQILGIFTERDAVRRVIIYGRDPAVTLLSEVMSAPVHTCRLADDVCECGERMARQHVRHLVVVEGGALVGVISQRDVLAVELRGK
jgi:CBS domain-containing protein